MRTRVKICGITRREDAAVVAASGADALGLVFYPDSPRHIEFGRALAKITSECRGNVYGHLLDPLTTLIIHHVTGHAHRLRFESGPWSGKEADESPYPLRLPRHSSRR